MQVQYNELGRFYAVIPDPEKLDVIWYPSVTTVLSYGKKDELAEIAARYGEEEWAKLQRDGIRRGNEVHNLCEAYLKGEADLRSVNPYIFSLFLPIKNYLDEHVVEPMYIESPVLSHVLKVAGRVDLIARTKDGYITLIDFKTSKSHKKKEWVKSYYLQCAAYGVCIKETLNIDVNQFKILITEEESTVLNVFEDRCSNHIGEFIKLRKAFPNVQIAA